jgi:PD-(D/E)XK nuclease superfamily protein
MKTDAQIEEFIRDALEKNFEQLRLESGHSISADLKRTALNQALFYWRKLKDVATRITETEVRLNLPGQVTPQNRKFGIEGVVDIVREGDKVVMYDIKTHNAAHVKEHTDEYEGQLNIYAHIWQNLRGQPLDEVAIIATAYPDGMKDALAMQDEEQMLREFEEWDPIVGIEVNPDHVENIIRDFGRAVDCIENGEFAPAPLEVLKSQFGKKNALFGTSVCRNCDARFSCDSYRRYATGSRAPKEAAFKKYLDDYGTELDQQDWLSSELGEATTF